MTLRRHNPKPKPRPLAGAPPDVWQILTSALEFQLSGVPMDAALSRALSKGPRLAPAELHTAVAQHTGLNRHWARLSWALQEEGGERSASNLLLAWLALEHRTSPEDVRRALPLDRSTSSLVARLGRRRLDDPAAPEDVRLECPPAFAPALRAALGTRFADEMRASLEPAPVDLRVNTLKTSVEAAERALNDQRIGVEHMRWSPWGLRCAPEARISSTSVFRDGLVEFQDEGSQLVALLADAGPEHQVLDYCAGAGGKTLALAAAMQNRGHLVAADINTDRLARTKERLKRAGAENAERRVIDNDWAKRHKARFDRVLVDAPCSGTGSWRRNPDARWSPAAAKLDELTALQDQILDRAGAFVRPGGRLTYATCSLLPVENDERIEAFLARHPDFALTDARTVWAARTAASWPSGAEKVLRLSPAAHGTDGFFAAVLTRAPAP